MVSLTSKAKPEELRAEDPPQMRTRLARLVEQQEAERADQQRQGCEECRHAMLDTEIEDLRQPVHVIVAEAIVHGQHEDCLLYTSPSPRDRSLSRMPSSA